MYHFVFSVCPSAISKMASSTFSHKCGSKRKNHQCGLGLCSTETENPNVTLPKRLKLRSDLHPEAILNIDANKDPNPKKLIERRCSKCARPIKGHPLPKGNKCTLEPLPMIEEIKSEQQLNKMKNARKRNRSEKAKIKARERNRTDNAKNKSKGKKEI